MSVRHEPCPKCGSKDNLARWPDGHAFCFGCEYHEPPTQGAIFLTPGSERMSSSEERPFEDGEVVAIKRRGLSQATCEKWNYRVGKASKDGRTIQIANYVKDGRIAAQKIRDNEKKFWTTGKYKNLPLYGQWLWGQGGRKVVVTEGELDALSVSQMQDNRWPVVSLTNGAGGAVDDITRNLEWLESYDEVVLCFDNDEVGLDAVEKVAPLFTPGKCKVAALPLKDASDMLQAGRGDELIRALWDAKEFRPDGIIDGMDVTMEYLLEAPAQGYSTPYPELNEVTNGFRKGEIVLVTAGTGIGKSTIVREIAHHFNSVHGLTTGNVFLEESYRKTVQGYLAIDNNIPLGDLRRNPKDALTETQYKDSMEKLIRNGRTFFYNHFGSLESEVLLSRLNYMAVGLGVDFIFLDHISIVVSGMDSSREGERKDIDKLMTKLRTLVERTGVGVVAISHLSKADGTPHEEGGRVALNDLRGSASLKQIPDCVIAMERDQQGKSKNVATLRVLKNREFGDTGPAGLVIYDRETGRLRHHESTEFPEDEPGDDTY
jgi:twinkle protein